MIHDPALIDRLSGLPTEDFEGIVYRATRKNLDPATPSTAGGRWSPTDGPAVLYTSLEKDGAMAEIAFHWSMFSPQPTKPALLHSLDIRGNRVLRLLKTTLTALGVENHTYELPNYMRTQEIGSAVAFIGCDGLLVPSARWNCENLILFPDNLALDIEIGVMNTEEVDWKKWKETKSL